MARKLRVGIIGCGGIAYAHLKAYKRIRGVEVHAVHDVSAEASGRLAEVAGADAVASIGDMIRLGVDAVSVCTPPGVHLEVCRPFIKQGIPILCEKPLAADAAAASRLAAAVRKQGSLFMTAFCHRFHPPVVALKKLIDRGVLGEALLFRNIFAGYLELKNDHRSQRELSGGGTLIDNGSHSADLFRFLVGEPTSVGCMIGTVRQQTGVEDFGAMTLSVGGKCFGEIAATHSCPVGSNALEWIGTKGSARLVYWNDLSYQVAGKEPVKVKCPDEPNRFALEVRHFVGCIRKGTSPAVSVEDGLKASRILSAAYLAADSGKQQRIRQ